MAIDLLGVKNLPTGWTQGKWENLRGKVIKDVIMSDDINRIEILLEDDGCFGVAGFDYGAGKSGTAGIVGFYLENVKEHAPLSAGANVDHGVKVKTTGEHENRAADRGCCVSPCSISSFLLEGLRHKDPAVRVMKRLAVFNAIMVVAFLIYKLTA